MVIASKPNNDRHFLSFSRKLFLSVISLFLVFAACFIAYQYQREKEYKVELLDTMRTAGAFIPMWKTAQN